MACCKNQTGLPSCSPTSGAPCNLVDPGSDDADVLEAERLKAWLGAVHFRFDGTINSVDRIDLGSLCRQALAEAAGLPVGDVKITNTIPATALQKSASVDFQLVLPMSDPLTSDDLQQRLSTTFVNSVVQLKAPAAQVFVTDVKLFTPRRAKTTVRK